MVGALLINVVYSFTVRIADVLMQTYTQYLMKTSHAGRA